jgi:hypothetical protein
MQLLKDMWNWLFFHKLKSKQLIREINKEYRQYGPLISTKKEPLSSPREKVCSDSPTTASKQKPKSKPSPNKNSKRKAK